MNAFLYQPLRWIVNHYGEDIMTKCMNSLISLPLIKNYLEYEIPMKSLEHFGLAVQLPLRVIRPILATRVKLNQAALLLTAVVVQAIRLRIIKNGGQTPLFLLLLKPEKLLKLVRKLLMLLEPILITFIVLWLRFNSMLIGCIQVRNYLLNLHFVTIVVILVPSELNVLIVILLLRKCI